MGKRLFAVQSRFRFVTVTSNCVSVFTMKLHFVALVVLVAAISVGADDYFQQRLDLFHRTMYPQLFALGFADCNAPFVNTTCSPDTIVPIALSLLTQLSAVQTPLAQLQNYDWMDCNNAFVSTVDALTEAVGNDQKVLSAMGSCK